MAKRIEEVVLESLDEKERAAVEEARKKFGEGSVYVLESESTGHRVIVRRPSREAYRRFRAERHNPDKRSSAIEVLFLGALLHPTPKEFERVLDEFPALGDTFGAQILDSCLGVDDATVKKA